MAREEKIQISGKINPKNMPSVSQQDGEGDPRRRVLLPEHDIVVVGVPDQLLRVLVDGAAPRRGDLHGLGKERGGHGCCGLEEQVQAEHKNTTSSRKGDGGDICLCLAPRHPNSLSGEKSSVNAPASGPRGVRLVLDQGVTQTVQQKGNMRGRDG